MVQNSTTSVSASVPVDCLVTPPAVRSRNRTGGATSGCTSGALGGRKPDVMTLMMLHLEEESTNRRHDREEKAAERRVMTEITGTIVGCYFQRGKESANASANENEDANTNANTNTRCSSKR